MDTYDMAKSNGKKGFGSAAHTQSTFGLGDIAGRIRHRRRELELTQLTVSKALGVVPQSVGFFEKGIMIVRAEQLPALADVLQTTIHWLLGLPEPTSAVAMPADDSSLTSDQAELLQCYGALSADDAKRLLEIARIFVPVPVTAKNR